MGVFKYQGSHIFDPKKLFNKKIGISSLGEITHTKMDNIDIGLAGFEELGKSIGLSPMMLSLDRFEGIAYVFYGRGGKLFAKFQKNTIDLLGVLGYEIRCVEEELKNVIKN